MNGIFLTVFLSGILASPLPLAGEKAYMRHYNGAVLWTETSIELPLSEEDPGAGLDFLLMNTFGKQGGYIGDWIEDHRGSKNVDSNVRDFELVSLTLNGIRIELEKRSDVTILRYERGVG